jgi:integrase
MPFTLRKHGRFWYARGTVPMRQSDGKIAKVRVEEPTREESKTRAARVAQDLWDEYQRQAYRPQRTAPTFTDAAITFVETKQPSKRDREFLARLIEHFGELPISQLDQTAMAEACTSLYPEGAKASTLHRAVYAPTIAVLRMAGVTTRFEKPKIAKIPLKIPDDEWFKKLLPHCEPQLAALLIFLSLTGRRISEALEATINDDGRSVSIGRTKTGKPIRLTIPPAVIKALGGIFRTKRPNDSLFSYGDRHNVYRALRRACRMAGVEWYGSHALGRHSFATRLLKNGYSTKFVAQAGGWASTRMVDMVYGHLEHDPVQDEALKVGEEWLRNKL